VCFTEWTITSEGLAARYFGQTPGMTLSLAAAVTTGVWRDDGAIARDNDRRTA
jgi:hypothetical protein